MPARTWLRVSGRTRDAESKGRDMGAHRQIKTPAVQGRHYGAASAADVKRKGDRIARHEPSRPCPQHPGAGHHRRRAAGPATQWSCGRASAPPRQRRSARTAGPTPRRPSAPCRRPESSPRPARHGSDAGGPLHHRLATRSSRSRAVGGVAGPRHGPATTAVCPCRARVRRSLTPFVLSKAAQAAREPQRPPLAAHPDTERPRHHGRLCKGPRPIRIPFQASRVFLVIAGIRAPKWSSPVSRARRANGRCRSGPRPRRRARRAAPHLRG